MSKSELIDLAKDLQDRLGEHETRETELERACGESQRLLDALMANTAAEVGFKGRDGRYILVSRQQAEIAGFSPESMTGKTAYDVYPEQTAEAIAAHDELVMKRGKPAEREIELAGNEGPRTFLAIKFPLFDETGEVSGIGAIANEITDRKRSEEALRKRDAQIKQAHEVAKIAYWSWDASTDLLSISPEMATILRVSPDAVEDLTNADFIERFVHPEDQSRVWQATELVNDGDWRFEIEYRLKPESGGTRWVREVGEALIDENGQATSEIGTIQDITDYKNAEEKLRQAQSLQAVGQLTGGVAHDFNNLLAVIMGNAEVLMLRGGKQNQPVQAILRAASRGAELTQRLLAFARQQPLDPQAIAVGSLLSDMTGMLHRTLGENIAIRTTSTPDVWQVLADPGQLETALLNLAINARDAMPEGGTLTIEAANLMANAGDPIDQAEITSGPCVVVTVSDTGCGMPPGVQERAFEPFFTTKDVGQGSGLGLSMVYGFVKQSGGHMSIHSREGHGTAVRLYLPRAIDGAVRASPQATPEDPKGQGQTILVLEDDADVRELAVTLLRDLGYEVLEAKDGEAALDLLNGDSAIDLLLTDVVLPGGLNGPEVVERARRRDISFKVLFMSGYAEQAINKGSLTAGAGELLNKPFRRAA
jgi:PAS domain S-box-containing protein